MNEAGVREIFSDAIRYWERRRVVYNTVLVGVVLAVFAYEWPLSGTAVSLDLVLRFFLLAVIANVFYCAAYLADFVAQFSVFRDAWRRHRWVLLAVGTTFAGIIARFASLGAFGSQP